MRVHVGIVMFLLLHSVSAVAQESPTVLLLVFEDKNENTIKVVQDVVSRMREVPVALEVSWEGPLPGGRTAAVAAEEALLVGDAVLVFYWFIGEGGAVHYHLRDDTGVRVMTRNLEGGGEMSTGDVIGLITSATVELLLDTGELSLVSPQEGEIMAPPPETDPRLYVSLGYVFHVASATPDTSHGGRLGAAVRLARGLRMYGDVAVSTPYQSSEAEVTVTSMEVPFHLGLALFASHGDFQFGGGIGGVFASVRKSASSSDPNIYLKEPYWGFGFGVEGFGRVEWRMGSHVALYGQLEVQVVPLKVVYAVDGGPTLFDEYWHVRPGFSVGLQLLAF